MKSIKLVYNGQLMGSWVSNEELGHYGEGIFTAILEGFVRHKNAGSAEHYATDYNGYQETHTLDIVAHGSERISVNGEVKE